jgi:L-serine deaminase
MKKSIITYVVVIALIALMACTAAFGLDLGFVKIPSLERGVTLGLDLVGGSEITYEAVIPSGTSDADVSNGMASAVTMLRQRLDSLGYSEEDVLRALAVAGIIGNLVKQNASVSGAECGCQAEIGTACSMAAAALAELFDMGIDQIEYAAEIALEHHLGLTCDPVCGLVQIPCIERNAVAAMRAINAVTLASFLTFTRKISFDLIVKTMYETGKDIHSHYRETSEGGLAKLYK